MNIHTDNEREGGDKMRKKVCDRVRRESGTGETETVCDSGRYACIDRQRARECKRAIEQMRDKFTSR